MHVFSMLTPSVDRSTKPQHHFMSTGSTTNNNFNLKTVLVPAELMVKFLNLAQSNTSKGIETGGFLFGKLVTTAVTCFMLNSCAYTQIPN